MLSPVVTVSSSRLKSRPRIAATGRLRLPYSEAQHSRQLSSKAGTHEHRTICSGSVPQSLEVVYLVADERVKVWFATSRPGPAR